MIHYIKFDLSFDENQMKKELAALASVSWPLHYQPRDYEGEWSALALRSSNGRSENVIISPVENTPYHDTELLRGSPYFQQLLRNFNCPLEAVRLLKLTTGSIIKEHSDADLCFEKGAIRLHIPVQTNPDVEFILSGDPLTMQEGECWYANFNLPHALANRGKTDRIHLVIDALVNDWVKELFSGKKVILKKESDLPEPDLDEKTIREMIFHLRSQNNPASHQLADEMEVRLPSSSRQE